jgi:hypothetical protein
MPPPSLGGSRIITPTLQVVLNVNDINCWSISNIEFEGR